VSAPLKLTANYTQGTYCSVANIQGLSAVLRFLVFADKQREDKLASALGGGLRPQLHAFVTPSPVSVSCAPLLWQSALQSQPQYPARRGLKQSTAPAQLPPGLRSSDANPRALQVPPSS
jgi:hypothetical protein